MSIKDSQIFKNLYRAYTNAVFGICKALFPVDEKLIIFESEGDFCDNAYALYKEFKDFGLDEKYRFVWAVDGDYENGIEIIKKSLRSPRTLYYLARAKHFIYDHNNMYATLRKRPQQLITYLGHGAGFKSGKGAVPIIGTEPDYRLSHGKMATAVLAHHWGVPDELYTSVGTPRLDWYYSDLTEVKKKLEDSFHYSDYKKVGLWMPTFRKSVSKEISDDSLNNETGLPLFTADDGLEKLDAFLKENGLLMILKLHHLQAELPSFSRKFSNLLILHDEDLKALDVQLYQFVPTTDFLITDYSSISVDYLLLDKPIIYTLDDYEEYNKTRGIWPENVLDYMPGEHVFTEDQFYEAVKDILSGNDLYKEDRERVKKEFHDFDDGDSAKRIAKLLKLL